LHKVCLGLVEGQGCKINVQVFMKKGEFGTRQLVTGAGFFSKVQLLPKLHGIPEEGANVD
jgi:hypothetical protein